MIKSLFVQAKEGFEMRILRGADLVNEPWKNGGGVTREIEVGNPGDRRAWRLSLADVTQDDAFSEFPGLARILTVVSGKGMVLEHSGGILDADLWVPVRFDGGLNIKSRMKFGALTDLNLIFDPTICDGHVTLQRGPLTRKIQRPESGLVAVHALSGMPTIGASRLNVADTALLETSNANLSLSEGDAILEIRLVYLD